MPKSHKPECALNRNAHACTCRGAAGFSERQIKDFVAQVKSEAGAGWIMLGVRFQEALIAERTLLVFSGQHAEQIDTNKIGLLLDAMLVEAGLSPAPSGRRRPPYQNWCRRHQPDAEIRERWNKIAEEMFIKNFGKDDW